MSRIEGKMGGEGEPVDAADILASLASDRVAAARRRKGAVRRYLSASEGWQEASNILGGAFAAEEPWLRTDKEE